MVVLGPFSSHKKSKCETNMMILEKSIEGNDEYFNEPSKMEDRAAGEAEAKREKMRMRLDAEGSIGMTCAFIGGFALSLFSELEAEMDDYIRWTFAVALCISGAACLFVVLVTGHLFWAGI